MSADVIPYARGLVAMSVCAANGISKEEIEQRVNVLEPTGIASPWRISSDPQFAGGQPNPCPCDQEPEIRRHWLLTC